MTPANVVKAAAILDRIKDLRDLTQPHDPALHHIEITAFTDTDRLVGRVRLLVPRVDGYSERSLAMFSIIDTAITHLIHYLITELSELGVEYPHPHKE